MNTERNHMDDLLKDKFSSFEGDIPMSDWFAIEEKLNKKRRFAWIWWAALPLLIVAGLGFYSLFTPKQTKTITKQTISQTKESNKEVDRKTNNFSEKIADEKFATKSAKNSSIKNINKNVPNSTSPNTKVEIAVKNEMIESNPISAFVYEPIELNSKSKVELYKFTLPTLEKIKDLAQTHPPIKGEKPSILSFEFGVNFAPAMGLDAIKENKSNWINRHYFSSIAGSSSLGSGFNNGIHAQMNIGNHWYIRQGIYSSTYSVYSNYNYIIDSTVHVNADKGIDNNYIPLIPDDIQHIQYSGKASIKYFSLPLIIGNRLNINKKMGIETKVGFNVSRLMSTEGKTVNPTYLLLEDINSNNTIKKWNTGLTISTGLFYKPNNKFIFTAEPTFSTLLSSARNKDYPVKTRYYNYGFNLNVNYILGRK